MIRERKFTDNRLRCTTIRFRSPSVKNLLILIIGNIWVAASAIAQGIGPAEVKREPRDQVKLYEDLEKRVEAFAIYGTLEVHLPLNKWGLVRHGQSICAIRFVKFHLNRSEQRPLMFSDASFFANYEWVYQSDGSGDFAKASATWGNGEASWKPNIWRFIRGNRSINCGEIQVDWIYPTGISLVDSKFNVETANHSNGVEVAATAWKELRMVDPNNAALIWRRYDPIRDVNRIMVPGNDVPIAKLPGAS